jgi:hypothetical protein
VPFVAVMCICLLIITDHWCNYQRKPNMTLVLWLPRQQRSAAGGGRRGRRWMSPRSRATWRTSASGAPSTCPRPRCLRTARWWPSASWMQALFAYSEYLRKRHDPRQAIYAVDAPLFVVRTVGLLRPSKRRGRPSLFQNVLPSSRVKSLLLRMLMAATSLTGLG